MVAARLPAVAASPLSRLYSPRSDASTGQVPPVPLSLGAHGAPSVVHSVVPSARQSP